MNVRRAIFCRVAVAALVALFSACGSDPSGDTGQTIRESSVTDELRRDGIFQAFGNGVRHYRNPFGLRRGLWETADANRDLLRKLWDRATWMQSVTSNPVRIVLHQPGGYFQASDDGMRGAIPTIQVMTGRRRDGSRAYPWRWTVWAEELTAITTAHPDWILGVYFSGQPPTAAAQDAVDARQAWEIYDHDNDRHRNLFMRVVDQWMAVGVREFMLDGSAKSVYAGGMPALAAAIREKGGRLYVEGHPRDEDLNLRMDLLQQVDGSLATHRFMVHNEPTSLDWLVPDGFVMMVTLTSHEIPEAPRRSTPTESDVLGYRERGFTLLSGGETFDHFITGVERPVEAPKKSAPRNLLDWLF